MTTTTETKTPASAPPLKTTTTTPPALPAVAQKVAHDMRGAVGILRSIVNELDGDEVAIIDAAAVAADKRRLLQMAERALQKLERTAGSLEAVAQRHRQPAADVDLEPMLQRAAQSTQLVERRPDVHIDISAGARPTRVRVVATSLDPALNDVFRWALRQRSSSLSVRVTATSAQVTLLVRVTTTPPPTTAMTAPASQVPFQDPLGLAAYLLADMGGGLVVESDAQSISIIITLPPGARS